MAPPRVADMAARLSRHHPGTVLGPSPMAPVIRPYIRSLEPRPGPGLLSRPVPHLRTRAPLERSSPPTNGPVSRLWLFMPARTCRCLAQNFDRYLKLIVHSLSFSFLSAARSRVLPLTINTSVQILRHDLIFSTAFDGRRRGQTPNLQGRIIRFNGVETGTREKIFLTSAPRKRARQGPRAECAAALNFGRHLGRPPLPLGNPGSAKPGPQAGITLMR